VQYQLFGLLLFVVEPLVVGPPNLICKPQQTIVRMQALHVALLVLSLPVIAAVATAFLMRNRR
jgi:hypothetical protein